MIIEYGDARRYLGDGQHFELGRDMEDVAGMLWQIYGKVKMAAATVTIIAPLFSS